MVAPASGHWPELRSWEFGGLYHRNTRPVETVLQIKYAYQSRTDAYLPEHFYTQFYKEDQQSAQHGVQNQRIFNSAKHRGYCASSLNIQKLYVLCEDCTDVFCTAVRKISSYFPTQH